MSLRKSPRLTSALLAPGRQSVHIPPDRAAQPPSRTPSPVRATMCPSIRGVRKRGRLKNERTTRECY